MDSTMFEEAQQAQEPHTNSQTWRWSDDDLGLFYSRIAWTPFGD